MIDQQDEQLIRTRMTHELMQEGYSQYEAALFAAQKYELYRASNSMEMYQAMRSFIHDRGIALPNDAPMPLYMQSTATGHIRHADMKCFATAVEPVGLYYEERALRLASYLKEHEGFVTLVDTFYRKGWLQYTVLEEELASYVAVAA